MDVRFLFGRPDPRNPAVVNTTKSIADRLGLDPSTVHRWKKDGSHPDGKSLGLLLTHGYLTADDIPRNDCTADDSGPIATDPPSTNGDSDAKAAG